MKEPSKSEKQQESQRHALHQLESQSTGRNGQGVCWTREGWGPGFPLCDVFFLAVCFCMYILIPVLGNPPASNSSKPHTCALPAFEGLLSTGQVRGTADMKEPVVTAPSA